VPLGLGGSGAWGAALGALGLRGFSSLGILPPIWESFKRESGSISRRGLHKE
jgi:hypothetical protein